LNAEINNKKREVKSVVVTSTQKENCAGINVLATDSSKQTRNTGKLRKQRRIAAAKTEATGKQFVSPELKEILQQKNIFPKFFREYSD